MWAALDVRASTRQRGCSSCSTRWPMSPQPTINSVGRRARCEVAVAGVGTAGKVFKGKGLLRRGARAQFGIQFTCLLVYWSAAFHELHHHRATRAAQLQCRARRSHTACGDTPGCGPALWLPRRRLRFLQEPAAARPCHPRRTPVESAQRGRRRSRLHPDLLRHTAKRLHRASAHRGRRWRIPGAEDAHPGHEHGPRRARCDGFAPAAAGQPEPAIPRRAVCRIHPERQCSAQLQHGQRAACRGQPAGHRTAPAPHARRRVHRPCVWCDEGAGHPAHRRAVGQFLPA